jgi:hypothetical protein
MSVESAAGLPSIGHLVELHDFGSPEATRRSSLGRVEGASAGRIVVALPADAAVIGAGRVGALFELIWPGRDGVMIQAATLTERHGGSQLELWEFASNGAARFEQRRHQPRVPVSGAITVTVESGPSVPQQPATLTGSLVDLSARAVRCLLAVEADDAVLSSGARVQCTFAPAGTPVSLSGAVHAAWTQDAPPNLRIVVQFDADQPGLDVVSQFVTATDAQLRGQA